MPDLPAFRRVYAEMVCACAGATDPRLVEAFAAVPREHYLGPGPWKFTTEVGPYVETPSDDPVYLYQNWLYAIDATRRLNNGLPGFLARLIDALALKAGDRVAHVGTGVGYYTAIMAEMVGPSGRVFGYEIDTGLAQRAAQNLAHYPHVEIAARSGAALDVRGLDALLINAGATHPLPAWLDALAPGGRLRPAADFEKPARDNARAGGRLVLLLTAAGRGGAVMKITRGPHGFDAAYVSAVWVYPCHGARDDRMEKALGRAFKKGGQEKVATLRRDRHRRDGSCWLHGRGWCLSTATI